MVGAMNVGTISTRFLPNFASNSLGLGFAEYQMQDVLIAAGDEIGIFHLGSTVVCIYPRDFSNQHSFVQTDRNIPILMGHSLIQQ
jgi:phosphatidylserine decarboxylase